MLLPSIFKDDVFDDFMSDLPFLDDKEWKKLEKRWYGRNGGRLMKTDIREEDDRYEMTVELPGFKKDDIKVSIINGYLTIQASKESDDTKEGKSIGGYIRRERYMGACQRSFYIGEGIEQSDIDAEFKHGVLRLYVPKKDTPKVGQRQYIPIE